MVSQHFLAGIPGQLFKSGVDILNNAGLVGNHNLVCGLFNNAGELAQHFGQVILPGTVQLKLL